MDIKCGTDISDLFHEEPTKVVSKTDSISVRWIGGGIPGAAQKHVCRLKEFSLIGAVFTDKVSIIVSSGFLHHTSGVISCLHEQLTVELKPTHPPFTLMFPAQMLGILDAAVEPWNPRSLCYYFLDNRSMLV